MLKNKYFRYKKCPKISVIMLNYNGLKYLKKTIFPILNLDYPNYEFVIVDNGSTDGSLKFINEIQEKKTKISLRLIKNGKNLGYSKGKNIGVKNAKGDYILLLDNDILMKKRKTLQKLVRMYSKEIGFIQPFLIDQGNKKTKHYGIYFSFYGTNIYKKSIKIKRILNFKQDYFKIGGPTGGCIFFSKKRWIKIGGLDESQPFNLDDIDIGSRAYIYGYENRLYTKDYFIHLGVKNSFSIKEYSRRFKLIFSGHGRSMIKNYKLKNLILRFPIFCIFQFFKAIKYSIKKKSFKIINSFFYSVGFFLKNLSDTLKERKKIQSKRVVKDDVFLKIKPPKFD